MPLWHRRLGLAGYNIIGYPEHSGVIRARAIRSHEPTEQRNYRTKPILNNPPGINWLRRVSGMAGAPGSAKPDGSLQRDLRRGDRQRRTNPSLHNSSDQERGAPSRVEPQPGACFHSVTGLLITGQHGYRISGATGQQNGQTWGAVSPSRRHTALKEISRALPRGASAPPRNSRIV